MQANGISLIELLVTIFITSILLLLVAPITNTTLQKNYLASYSQQIITIINYSRNQALMLGQNVLLVPNNKWSKGMILLVDKDADHKVSAGDLKLHEWVFATNSMLISWHGFISDNYVEFSKDTFSGASSGSFHLISRDDNSLKKTIIVNRFGRVRVVSM